MVVMGLYFEDCQDFVCKECCSERLKRQSKNDEYDLRADNRGWYLGCRKLKQSNVKAEKV